MDDEIDELGAGYARIWLAPEVPEEVCRELDLVGLPELSLFDGFRAVLRRHYYGRTYADVVKDLPRPALSVQHLRRDTKALPWLELWTRREVEAWIREMRKRKRGG